MDSLLYPQSKTTKKAFKTNKEQENCSQYEHSYKLDGVGPVDNRPSTD